MKFRLIQTMIALSVLLSACGGDDNGSSDDTGGGGDDGEQVITAAYTATVTTTFSEENFPTDYPENATFGTIVAIVHAPDVNVYSIGQAGSDGFKAYINDGDVSALENFISTQLGEENEGKFTIQSEGSLGAEESKTINLSFSPTRTRVTFLANLNPSPDWFLGVSSFDITDGDVLLETASIDLRAQDGGTSAGDTYTAEDSPENAPVSIITSPPISDGNFTASMGNLSLSRTN